MMLKKKLVGSTGSPLGRAGVRCEGGGCRGMGEQNSVASILEARLPRKKSYLR